MPFAPANNIEPPFYLLTQPIATSSSTSAANFTHPVIEYHFADDPPSNLLPKSDAETVIILDYENSDATPVARGLHHNLAVAGVKVTAAPGATAAKDGEVKRNDKMYIIETFSSSVREKPTNELPCELEDAQLLLTQFRERNAFLRRVLDQPSLKLSTSPPPPEPVVEDSTIP